MSDPKIGIVLPWRENFTLRKSGAIALCMRDFAAYSRFASSTTLLGAGVCEYSDVRYQRIVGWETWWRRARDAYAEAVAKQGAGFDLVEVQNRPYMMARLRRRLRGTKLALHLHNDPQTMDGSRTVDERRALLALCDAIYCVSEFIRGRFLDGLDDPAGKAVAVHNGVPKLDVMGPKAPIIAFVGRVIAIKGVAELVQAFAAAAADMPGWRLVIAGDDPDGLISGARSTVARERAALGDRLELLGQVSHAQAMALLARAEVAAVPSMWDDPCPRAAIEALANGCALVATQRGGLAEIADGAGVMVDPSDTTEFAAQLRKITSDAALRLRLQQAAKHKADQDFDIVEVAAKLDRARVRALGLV